MARPIASKLLYNYKKLEASFTVVETIDSCLVCPVSCRLNPVECRPFDLRAPVVAVATIAVSVITSTGVKFIDVVTVPGDGPRSSTLPIT